MNIEINTIVSNDLAEKIFKETQKGEINVKKNSIMVYVPR